MSEKEIENSKQQGFGYTEEKENEQIRRMGQLDAWPEQKETQD